MAESQPVSKIIVPVEIWQVGLAALSLTILYLIDCVLSVHLGPELLAHQGLVVATVGLCTLHVPTDPRRRIRELPRRFISTSWVRTPLFVFFSGF